MPANYVEASRWLRSAAGQGLPFAQAMLGVMQAAGEAVPQDFSESYFWMIIANAGLGAGEVKDAIGEEFEDAVSLLRVNADCYAFE
ncbi:MAG: hypothetical protein AAFX52_03970 [Pseudomonadota bacterium]